jgi:hypothetical protein
MRFLQAVGVDAPMSIEEMRLIAERMTAQGVPINFSRYYEGIERSVERVAGGDPYRREKLLARHAEDLANETLTPTWRVALRGDFLEEENRFPDWHCVRPNLLALSHEVLEGVEGCTITVPQVDLYFLALFADNEEWINHYRSGGNLWDKVQEGFGLDGPIQMLTKRRFLNMSSSHKLLSTTAFFPWLCAAQVEYENRVPKGRTFQGSMIPNERYNLWTASMWSSKEAIRNAVLNGFRQSTEVPYVIHYDGVIVPEGLVEAYTKGFERVGLRTVTKDFRGPSTSTKSRFDIIEGF